MRHSNWFCLFKATTSTSKQCIKIWYWLHGECIDKLAAMRRQQGPSPAPHPLLSRTLAGTRLPGERMIPMFKFFLPPGHLPPLLLRDNNRHGDSHLGPRVPLCVSLSAAADSRFSDSKMAVWVAQWVFELWVGSSSGEAATFCYWEERHDAMARGQQWAGSLIDRGSQETRFSVPTRPNAVTIALLLRLWCEGSRVCHSRGD